MICAVITTSSKKAAVELNALAKQLRHVVEVIFFNKVE